MISEEKLFGTYLKIQREYYGITQEELSRGLCQLPYLQAYEANERLPEKMLQDCLLARLGESGYDFESMLFSEDYAVWEFQRDILDSLDNMELGKAEALLAQYEQTILEENIVERQFLLTMKVQWLELSEASKEECRSCLEEAVALTIPEPEERKVNEFVLSIQELNLLLEYFDRQENCPERIYTELKRSLASERYDVEHKVILGAKTAWFYSRFLKSRLELVQEPVKKRKLVQKALAACADGIELLRKSNKSYFLFELLELQHDILKLCLAETQLSGKESLQLKAEVEQNRQFYQVFHMLYREFQVPEKTNGFTCFYRKQEIYCINEVIWTRRNMLGLSREELNNACGKKTLDRLESTNPEKRTRVQRGVAQRIFTELRLPMDFERAQIITNDVTIVRMEKQYRRLCNQTDYEEAEKYLQRIKKKLSLDNFINRQYVDYEEVFLKFKQKKISREKYIARAIEILEYTLPYEVALAEIKEVRPKHGSVRAGAKYLTNREITILTNLGSNSEGKSSLVYWNALKEYCECLEKKCTLAPIYSRYGFAMSGVANQYGSDGKYEESNRISKRIIHEALRLHNVSYVERNVYNLLWNDRTEKGLPLTVEDPVWRQGILYCWNLNVFSKREEKANRRLEKLKFDKQLL